MVNLKKYLEAQQKLIQKEKWIASEKAGKDLGDEYIHVWIKKYAKKFRQDYVLEDLKEALTELNEIQKNVNEYLEKISVMNKFVMNCQEKILEGIELLKDEAETENRHENKNGNDKK